MSGGTKHADEKCPQCASKKKKVEAFTFPI